MTVRAVIQRVQKARVLVGGEPVASIEKGLLTLLGVERGDTPQIATQMIEKLLKLRVFEDSSGKMNLSLKDVSGSHLLVSQFTLLADCSKGNRPSFIAAGDPAEARRIFELAVDASRDQGVPTECGVFGADMKIELTNDGPATFVLRLSGE